LSVSELADDFGRVKKSRRNPHIVNITPGIKNTNGRANIKPPAGRLAKPITHSKSPDTDKNQPNILKALDIVLLQTL
jgi:hypothetical protein